MGGTTFVVTATGSSAKDAFRGAVDDARHEHGHRGYTGTIAEKRDFDIIEEADSEQAAHALADRLIDAGDERIDDKWGPAGCIPIKGTDKYVFFGWASC